MPSEKEVSHAVELALGSLREYTRLPVGLPTVTIEVCWIVRRNPDVAPGNDSIAPKKVRAALEELEDDGKIAVDRRFRDPYYRTRS